MRYLIIIISLLFINLFYLKANENINFSKNKIVFIENNNKILNFSITKDNNILKYKHIGHGLLFPGIFSMSTGLAASFLSLLILGWFDWYWLYVLITYTITGGIFLSGLPLLILGIIFLNKYMKLKNNIKINNQSYLKYDNFNSKINLNICILINF